MDQNRLVCKLNQWVIPQYPSDGWMMSLHHPSILDISFASIEVMTCWFWGSGCDSCALVKGLGWNVTACETFLFGAIVAFVSKQF